jgi:cytochrome P450
MAYCLNYSPPVLATPDFRYPFLISSQQMTVMLWVFKYIPTLRYFFMKMPRFLIPFLPNNLRHIYDYRHEIDLRLGQILANPDIVSSGNRRETIYHHLLGYSGPEQKRRVFEREELLQEADLLLSAGSDTIGHACNVGFFHVLNSPDVLKRLIDELDDAWPEKDSRAPTSTLEKLPYLVNCNFLLYKMKQELTTLITDGRVKRDIETILWSCVWPSSCGRS